MNKIQIVPMKDAYIPEIAALEKQCFSDPWSDQSLREELGYPFSVFLVAVCDSAVAGYAGAHHLGDSSYICNIAVAQPFRRQGIASRLLQEHIRLAAEHGMTEITLEVRTSNTPARELYEKFGFTHIGTRPDYYMHPQEDAEIYTKSI